MSSSNAPIDKGKARATNREDSGLQEEVPRPWKCGDPFKYSIPREEGVDYWSTLLEPLMKVDKAQCEAWKNEVENLLIFTGLFSAVVTAFVIESYKNLQPDHSQMAIFLLAHIAARLDNPLNATASFIEPDPIQIPLFTPSSSSIHVNACWFLSLMLSLSSVLVGIISLQWLREHQSYHQTSTARQKFTLFHMRAEMLEKWHVSAIITSLPLLLQIALVLFFAGVLEFLLALGIQQVFIPVLTLIVVTLAFFAATTVLPTFQAYIHDLILSIWLILPRPTVPCPYKSPQSHAFHLLLTFNCVRRLVGILLLAPICLVFSIPVRVFVEIIKCIIPMPDSMPQLNVPSTFGIWRVATSTTWMKSDLAWLSIRGIQALKRSSMPSIEYRIPDTMDAIWSYDVEHGPLYDEVLGLLDAGRHSMDDGRILAAYHCFQECLFPKQREDDKDEPFCREVLCNYFEGVGRLLCCTESDDEYLPFVFSKQFILSNNLSPGVLHDEVLRSFLADICNSFQNPRKFSRALLLMEMHQIELEFRLDQVSFENHVHGEFWERKIFSPPGNGFAEVGVLSKKMSADFTKQAHILYKSFLDIVALRPTEFRADYFSYSSLLRGVKYLTDVEFLKPSLLSTLSVIRSKLLPYLDPESMPPHIQSLEIPPMELRPLFCLGAIVVAKISKHLPDFYQDIEIAKAVDELGPILHKFQELIERSATERMPYPMGPLDPIWEESLSYRSRTSVANVSQVPSDKQTSTTPSLNPEPSNVVMDLESQQPATSS